MDLLDPDPVTSRHPSLSTPSRKTMISWRKDPQRQEGKLLRDRRINNQDLGDICICEVGSTAAGVMVLTVTQQLDGYL